MGSGDCGDDFYQFLLPRCEPEKEARQVLSGRPASLPVRLEAELVVCGVMARQAEALTWGAANASFPEKREPQSASQLMRLEVPRATGS